MPMPVLSFTKKKDDRIVNWFRDNQGRVRTSNYAVNWVKADQIRELADYGIRLQIEQARAGLGSDGSPMPPLKGGGGRAIFVSASGGKARFQYQGYAALKSARGLQPIRDLYGLGDKGGHMLDTIRVNYLDDQRATIAITATDARNKARGNENRAPWWGWGPDAVQKLGAEAARIFQTGTAEFLLSMGLIGANALAQAKSVWRKVA